MADDHLKLNLDFLDEKTPQSQKTVPAQSSINQSTTTNGPNIKWWKVITALGIPALIFLAIAMLSESSKSPKKSSMTVSENNEVPSTDNFRCSSYHQKKVDVLKPTTVEEASLATEHDTLEKRAQEISNLKDRIDNMKVDENSQAAIDSYNMLVNRHNSLTKSFRRNFAAFQTKANQYDAAIKAYNNYLSTNCERVK